MQLDGPFYHQKQNVIVVVVRGKYPSQTGSESRKHNQLGHQSDLVLHPAKQFASSFGRSYLELRREERLCKDVRLKLEARLQEEFRRQIRDT
jgi:hypothetical protein